MDHKDDSENNLRCHEDFPYLSLRQLGNRIIGRKTPIRDALAMFAGGVIAMTLLYSLVTVVDCLFESRGAKLFWFVTLYIFVIFFVALLPSGSESSDKSNKF